jgi:hypothetical protein
MKTLVIDKNTDLTNVAQKDEKAAATINPVTEENKHPKFVAGNPVNKDNSKPAEAVKETPKVEAAKPKEEPKAEAPKQEAPKQEAPKAEPAKTEEVKPEPKKFVLNLEGTLKFIEEMHRKAKQRIKLQETIKNLDDFEVELRDEADSADTNYYTGCTLTITDDRNRKFETKNPTIIWTVAQLVNNMCVDKLAEIEAGIVIPS